MFGPAISAVFLEQLLYLSLLFAKQIYLSDMVDSECNGTGEISHYFAYQKSKLFAVDKIKYIISTKYIIRVSFFHTIRKWDPKNLGNLSLPVPSNPPTLPQLSSWTSRGIRKNLYLYLLINTCLFVVFFFGNKNYLSGDKLRLETKGSRFNFDCYLCPEVSSVQ